MSNGVITRMQEPSLQVQRHAKEARRGGAVFLVLLRLRSPNEEHGLLEIVHQGSFRNVS